MHRKRMSMNAIPLFSSYTPARWKARLISAAVYAPMAMKPQWPSESCPMKPSTRFRLAARMMR